ARRSMRLGWLHSRTKRVSRSTTATWSASSKNTMGDRELTPLALSIVVPVYRSAEILPKLIEETQAVLAGSSVAGNFELLLVCDPSPDNSWSVIESLASRYPFVRGIHLRRNAGQHNATMAGLRFARGRRIVVMDDDLQHPPAAIPSMLAALDRGF